MLGSAGDVVGSEDGVGPSGTADASRVARTEEVPAAPADDVASLVVPEHAARVQPAPDDSQAEPP